MTQNTPDTAKLRRTTGIVTALSILPHLLCCALPAAAALISLGTTVGLAASLASNPLYLFVDTYHRELIALAIASVVLSGILNLIAWRIDCRAAKQNALVQGHCAHADCTPKKTASFRIFFLSLFLLVLDLSWFYAEEHVLGLHHHHEDGAHVEAHDHHHH